MLSNEGDPLQRVIVCTPRSEYFRVADLESQNIREIADPERTRLQHDRLKFLMGGYGIDVIDVDELEDHPNSVFTRDASLCTPQGYIKLRMGLEARRGEEGWMAGVLDSLGEPFAGEIKAPGTAEGGDIILAGRAAFVGQSARTNKEGVKQVASLLKGMGFEIRVAEITSPYLHLGGAMSVIGPERVLCCQNVFPSGFFKGYDTVEVPLRGPSTGNVICLENSVVAANAAENREAICRLEDRGIRVHKLDLSEFRKGSGGPSCLILPIERGRSVL